MMRPSPFLPRRKSTSRSACVVSPAAPRRSATPWSRRARQPAWSISVTRTLLPSICVSKVCGLLRLNTTRVRLPACTTLRLRSAGSPTSCAVRPSPLPVSGKSSAMRGGLLIANPAGGLASGDFSVNLTMVRPERPLGNRQRLDAVGGSAPAPGPMSRDERWQAAGGNAAPQARQRVRIRHRSVARAHLRRSCRCSASASWIVLDRSVQSPAPSCTSSLSLISASSISTTTPKFWPM